MVIIPIGFAMILIMLIGGGKAAIVELLIVLLVGVLAYFMCSLTNPKFGQLVIVLVALLSLQVFTGSVMPLIDKIAGWIK